MQAVTPRVDVLLNLQDFMENAIGGVVTRASKALAPFFAWCARAHSGVVFAAENAHSFTPSFPPQTIEAFLNE